MRQSEIVDVGSPTLGFSSTIGIIVAMTDAEVERLLEEMFDCALIYHGYTKYLRDYEMVIYQSVDPNPKYGLVPRHLRFVFRICPEVSVSVRPPLGR